MKRFITIMAATVVTVFTVASCSKANTSETVTAPFGNYELLTVLEDAGVEPVTDDYIVQCYQQTVYMFDSDGTIERSVEAAIFLSVQSFNTQGLSLQNNVCYLFENAADAEAYFDYASQGIYSVSYNNDRTVRLELESNTYKQDVIQMLDEFDPNITFVSKPYLTKEQLEFLVLEYTIEKCK